MTDYIKTAKQGRISADYADSDPVLYNPFDCNNCELNRSLPETLTSNQHGGEYMVNRENYAEFAAARAPKSKHLANFIKAYAIGGGICMVGQGISNLWKAAGLDAEAAGSAVCASMSTILC